MATTRGRSWGAVLAVILGVFSTGCDDGLREFLFGPTPVPEQPPSTVAAAPTVAPPPTPDPVPPPVVDDGYQPNEAPVARVGAKVFFVECDGQQVPGSEHASQAPVGCRLHMDCTAKDAHGEPTTPRGLPHWRLSDPQLVTGGTPSDFTPTFLIREAGTLTLGVEIDGVRSNDVVVRFR